MIYILRRLVWLPFVLWAVASLTFLSLRLVPGDPLGQVALLVLDQSQLDRIRSMWALDQPLWNQYLLFLGNLVKGDLGLSMASGQPLTYLLYEKLPPTIELALTAMVISTLIGVVTGVVSATTRNRGVDYGARTFAILGLSPAFTMPMAAPFGPLHCPCWQRPLPCAMIWIASSPCR